MPSQENSSNKMPSDRAAKFPEICTASGQAQHTQVAQACVQINCASWFTCSLGSTATCLMLFRLAAHPAPTPGALVATGLHPLKDQKPNCFPWSVQGGFRPTVFLQKCRTAELVLSINSLQVLAGNASRNISRGKLALLSPVTSEF